MQCICAILLPCSWTVFQHAQDLNVQIFQATTKRYFSCLKIFVKARIILVGEILTELRFFKHFYQSAKCVREPC